MEKETKELNIELGDNVLYSIVWLVVLTAFVTLVLSIMSYNKHELDTMATMATAGAHPMAASCAATGYSSDSCQIYLTGEAIRTNNAQVQK